jgi:hypothetical protein
MVGKHVPYPKFPLRKTPFRVQGKVEYLKKKLIITVFQLPLKKLSVILSRFLLIPSQASDCEDVQGSQHSDSLSQSFEPLTFHDPFLRWIEHFPESMTWHHFFPPTRLHELDLTISNDTIHFLTHVIFVLNLSLLWFMMKHRGRYCETLLGWFHWLFDYT